MLDNFFTAKIITKGKIDTVSANITLNKEHQIYNGHFPGMHVVPGVCLVEIIRQVLSRSINEKLFISKIVSVKFVASVDPSKNHNLNLNATISNRSENSFEANIVIFDENKVYVKFKGKFVESTTNND